MDPNRLAAWEQILKSSVAASLLLLAAVVALTAAVVWLYRENQSLKREIIDSLKAQADLNVMLNNAEKVIHLFDREHGRSDSAGVPPVPAQ